MGRRDLKSHDQASDFSALADSLCSPCLESATTPHVFSMSLIWLPFLQFWCSTSSTFIHFETRLLANFIFSAEVFEFVSQR